MHITFVYFKILLLLSIKINTLFKYDIIFTQLTHLLFKGILCLYFKIYLNVIW